MGCRAVRAQLTSVRCGAVQDSAGRGLGSILPMSLVRPLPDGPISRLVLYAGCWVGRSGDRRPDVGSVDVLFQSVGGATECSRWSSAAGEVVFENCPPLKPFSVRKGKRLAPGWWWSATTGRLVHYGSAAMRLHVMLLDRDPRVSGLAARPLELRWHVPGGVRAHAPQLMLRLADGQGCSPTAREEESCLGVSGLLLRRSERSVRRRAGGTGCSGPSTRSTGAM